MEHLSWSRSPIADETWSYLARLCGDACPLLPSLRRIVEWQPTPGYDDLRLLASPQLQSLSLYNVGIWDPHGEEIRSLALTMQHMFANAPGLTELRLNSCKRDLLTRFPPEAIQQLKTLQVEVEEVGDVAMDWYPSPDALRVAANLPALEHLLVETNTGPHLDFTGFHSLLTLQIIDCGRGDDTTWLLARCSSPHLRELTIDFTNLYDFFNWEDVHTLCSTIAQSAPQLRCLDFTPGILDLPEAPDNSEHAADILLTVVHPLFALRQLTVLTICFDLSEISLSDAVLEAFAEAWPMLVRLTICFIKILHIDPEAPHLYPANITLRSLGTFSECCPQLQVLHIPHIYVPPRMDCDTAGGGEQLQGRCLKELVICRAAIGDVQRCAQVIRRVFPRLDAAKSRTSFLRSHNGQCLNPESVERDGPCNKAWLGVLGALQEHQTPGPSTDLPCPPT